MTDPHNHRDPRDGLLYRKFEPKASQWKAALQMLTGVATVVGVLIYVVVSLVHLRHGDSTAGGIQKGVFDIVGVGLAVAAAAELAYTLFTYGPDEALDPAILAVSAALIIQLGADLDGFVWTDALTTCLFVVAIAGLIATRRFLAQLH